jgi:hypothetical protein
LIDTPFNGLALEGHFSFRIYHTESRL